MCACAAPLSLSVSTRTRWIDSEARGERQGGGERALDKGVCAAARCARSRAFDECGVALVCAMCASVNACDGIAVCATGLHDA